MSLILNKWFSKKGKIKIEFCQNNLDTFLDEDSLKLFHEFFKCEKIVIKEYKCLSHCETCEKRPYAKMDGTIIQADSPQELLSMLQSIKKNC